MILADKIIDERKKLGLSQEELAEKLSVSRQAVSKWEGAQSVPDLQKIIAMSELFSVSTDYLLKDDAQPEHHASAESEADSILRQVSMEEANDFMEVKAEESKKVSLGVLLCISCPVLLILLNGLVERGIGGITEAVASAIGLSALFIQVAAAVFLFVRSGIRTARFDYLEKEAFETAYGVTGLVKEKKAAYEPTFTLLLALGIVLCVLSPLPVIVTSRLKESAGVLIVSLSALLLCFVAAGVYMIVRAAIVRSGYEILLQEGDYTKAEKKHSKAIDAASGAYWCIVTAAYLAWSFHTGDWQHTWIGWPVAGVLFAPFIVIVKHLCQK